jgi:hypothetical protein
MKKRTVRSPRLPSLQVRLTATVLTLGLLAPLVLHAQQQSQREQRNKQIQQGIDGYIGEDAMQVQYRRNVDLGEFGKNDAGAGFFINESRDLIGIADLLVNVGRAERSHPAWSLLLGPRAYGALLSIENQDIFSIALGGNLAYHLGRDRETSVSVTAFYAPDITTFGNANSVSDVSLQIETPLTPAARVYFGYRWFRFDLVSTTPGISGGDRDIDEGFHVGVDYRF